MHFPLRIPVLILFLLMICALPAAAQTVTTLVAGPGAFDDSLSLDALGNLYASYYYGGQVARITPAGTVSTFAASLSNPNGSTFDADGNLYIAEAGANRITKVTPAGVPSVFLTGITNPTGLVFDPEGNLFIAQYQLSRISKLDTSGVLSVFMSGGGLNGPVGLQMDDDGNLYIGNFTDGRVLKRTPAGAVSVIADLPGWLGFIALAGDAIYATGFQVHTIYRAPISGTGKTVFAGNGVAGQADGDVSVATFNGPNGIVASPDGDTLYVTDFNTRSVRVISGLAGVSSVAECELPASGAQLGNHPNPFNPSTVLRYRVSMAGTVSLRVFDARGRQVAQLVDTHQESGPHEVRFDGKGLPSGVYFSRLEIGGVVVSAKMVLAK